MKKLFGTFMVAAVLIGLTTFSSAQASGTAYLFSTFKETAQDGLRFAYSLDGYHWTNMPGVFIKPEVGGKIMRDPSLLRGADGIFHLVWTSAWHGDQGFGYAESKDLIHWSSQKFVPIMTNEPTTVNVWAPELFYDAKQSRYLVTWASTIPGRFPDMLEKNDNNHRLYYTSTRDFKTFAAEQLLIDPGFSVIDPFIVKEGSRYILICKDNSRPMLNLRVAFGKSPAGPWENVSEPFTEKFTEGPCALKVHDDWLIYYDAYREKIYGAVKTRDFKNFTNITSEVSFPEGHKHGTAVEVPREILDALLTYSATLTKTNI